MIIGLAGLPATGKTTLIRALRSAHPEFATISSDQTRKHIFRSMLTPTGKLPERMYAEDVSDFIYDTIIRASVLMAKTGKTVIVDASFHKRSRRMQLEDAAAQEGIEVRWILTFLPMHKILDRLRNRRFSIRSSDADERVFRKMQASWERLDPPYLKIDSDRPIDYRVRIAVNWIEKGIRPRGKRPSRGSKRKYHRPRHPSDMHKF